MLAHVWVAEYSRIETTTIHQHGNIKDFLTELSKGSSKVVYFHNLKFDGHFILHYYLAKRYKVVEFAKEEGEISSIYSEQGAIYNIRVPFKDSKGRTRTITFLDSFKLFPYSLSKIAKQFNFEVQKGELNHDIYRPVNHVLTPKEKDYVDRDIIVLRTAIEDCKRRGLNKITIGANCLEYYKELIGGDREFRKLFPVLTEEEDKDIRPAYKGGCNMLMEKYKGRIVYGWSYDVNSMYPDKMDKELMPYGKPIYQQGKLEDKEGHVFVQHMRCSFFIKPKKLPNIQIKNTSVFAENEWVENSPLVMDLWLTNVDLKMFREHYKILDEEYIGGYYFKAMRGLFSKYIRHFNDIKIATEDAGEREWSKLYNNNLYGKFGTNPHRNSIMLGLKNGIVAPIETIPTEAEPVYLPVAIFTTSYARYELLSKGQLNYDSLMYCDTDSLHLSKPAVGLELHNTKLGAYKFEYEGYMKHLKQKTYCVQKIKEVNRKGELVEVDEFEFRCAGMNKDYIKQHNVEVSFETFCIGATFPKLKMRKCIGGLYPRLEEHKIK